MSFQLNMLQRLVYILWNTWGYCTIVLRIWDSTAYRARLLLAKAFIKERLHVNAQIQPLVPFYWTIRNPCMHLVNYYVFRSINKHKSTSILLKLSEYQVAYIGFISNLQLHRELVTTCEIHLYYEISVNNVQFSLRPVSLIWWKGQLVPIDKVNISFDWAIKVFLEIAWAYFLIFICRPNSTHYRETLLGVSAFNFVLRMITNYLKQLGVQYTVYTWRY